MEDLRDYSRQEETAKPKGLEARHTTNLREGDLAFGVLVFLFTLPSIRSTTWATPTPTRCCE